MVDKVSQQKRSDIMRAVKSRDSKIELEFRRLLWRKGFRYRKNARNYYGKPDIALRKYRTVIFIDSCFWHGCSEHCRMPSSKEDYWIPKIKRNQERDVEVNQHYKSEGWEVIRIWEHEISNNLENAVDDTIQRIYKRVPLTR